MKSDELIKKLRRLARRRDLAFTIDRRRGKGGHIAIRLADAKAIVPTGHGELKAGTLANVLRALGVKKEDL